MWLQMLLSPTIHYTDTLKSTLHIAACKHVTVRGVWLPFHKSYICVLTAAFT